MRDINRIPTLKRTLADRLSDGAERVAKETIAQIERGFERGTTATGDPWPELDESTIRSKGHGDILVDSGALRDSFDYETDFNHVTRHYEVTLFSDDAKLVHHEYGAPDAGIPPRPVLRPAADWLGQQRKDDPLAQAVDMAIQAALLSGGTRTRITSRGGGR